MYSNLLYLHSTKLSQQLDICLNFTNFLFLDKKMFKILFFNLQCELYHWADVLDIFDDVLERACKKESEKSWTLVCDLPENTQVCLKIITTWNTHCSKFRFYHFIQFYI